MTLILAVEPDPRQASRLSSVLRGRRHTEVVVAKSAGTAIEMMRGRVPNVLLTSQLLAPQDEARLADWVKELGPAGTRVQALTIPILAPKATTEEPQRGLLSGFRRRTKQGPQGCEPRMFAEHVSAYLEQGLAERMDDVTPQVAPVAEASMAEAAVPEPELSPEPMLLEPAPEPILSEPTPEAMVYELASPDPVREPASDTFISEVHVSAPHAAEEDEGLWLLTRSPQVIEFTDEPAATEPETAPLGLLPPVPSPQVLTLPTEMRPMAPFEVVFEPPQVLTVRDNVDNLALRRSVAESAPPPAVLVPLEAAAEALAPVQDEWGFFDPSKCGFAALLEKLDEITDDDRQGASDSESSVRIVTHY
jgi:CheY-like chemotaxis protein